MPATDTVQVILEVEGGSDLLRPDRFSGVPEAVISGKIIIWRSHFQYLLIKV